MERGTPASAALGDVRSTARRPGGEQGELLARLERPAAYPHPVTTVRRLETHISHVFLTGQYVYKIKKPVNLGFLDFRLLERRAHYCREEFRLNRRFSPELYLGVVPISDTDRDPCVGSADHVVEYAVRMREFPQSSLLDRQLARGGLAPGQIDALADRVAALHGTAARHSRTGRYGGARVVWADFSETVGRLRELLARNDREGGGLSALGAVERWARQRFDGLRGELGGRKRHGFIRECHGDLHLANIAWWREAPQLFDGIEFSARLRWIDVISDLAFISMDLSARGRPDYAWRLVNRYLESTGDYQGLKLLAFYEVYRALVRAMVARMRAVQAGGGEGEGEAYLAFARRATAAPKRMLILMHGVSGSGKTTVAQSVLETVGAIRIRSDVERKRLAGLAATTRCGALPEGGIYAAESTAATYRHLLELARSVLDAGYPVVVDAASLQGWQREIFQSEARRREVPFRLLSCRADRDVLEERLRARAVAVGEVSDAGPDILPYQTTVSEPLSAAERLSCLVIDASAGSLAQALHRLKAEVGG